MIDSVVIGKNQDHLATSLLNLATTLVNVQMSTVNTDRVAIISVVTHHRTFFMFLVFYTSQEDDSVSHSCINLSLLKEL